MLFKNLKCWHYFYPEQSQIDLKSVPVKTVWHSLRLYREALFSKTTECKWSSGFHNTDNRGLLAGCPNTAFWLVNFNWLANTWTQHWRWTYSVHIHSWLSVVYISAEALSGSIFPPQQLQRYITHLIFGRRTLGVRVQADFKDFLRSGVGNQNPACPQRLYSLNCNSTLEK